MIRRSTRPALAGIATLATIIAALWLATPASAFCQGFVGDPARGYSGSIGGIECGYEGGAPESWSVPSYVAEATFSLHGADDTAASAGGGHVEATLSLTPGETLTLEPGGSGNASVVSLDGSPLFVAGGGNGSLPNYATPAASGVTSNPPGGPFELVVNGVPTPRDGRISVTWGRITKDPCTVPQLKGMRPVAARDRLTQLGCPVGTVRRRLSRPANRGRVIKQWPRSGSVLPEDGLVYLVVGRGRSGPKAPAR